jgi:hypothetical protein
MRQLLKIGSLLLSLLILVALPAQARDVIVTPVDPSTIQKYDSRVPSATCEVGNVNPAYWAIGGFLAPPERYAVVFRPQDSSCATCPLGYQISDVHILLQTSAAMTVVMSVGLQSATFPTDPGCAEPGPDECVAGPYQVNLPSAGLWDISLPITCDCAFKDFTYLLTVDFQSVSGGTPDLVTDNFPGACTSWNDYGVGWVDLLPAAGFPGNLKIWADADCCEVPIGTSEESVGGLKERFKQ